MSARITPLITVVGIGEDGLDGLTPKARGLIDRAEVLVGGERHLSKVPAGGEQRINWDGGFDAAFDKIEKMKDRRVVVLASGDPLHYGVGANIIRRFGAEQVNVIPAPGAFSLAAAAKGWPLANVECLTVHGRALEAVNLHLAPGRRLLVLSRDAETPEKLARLLTARGFGPSAITVLGNLGGGGETRTEGTAENWTGKTVPDLNTMAVECVAGDGADVLARVPGLPDDAFEHDGLITKREVRAATIARLTPLPDQVLWDVGAGSGAVAIEWLRAEPSAAALAVERHPGRAAVIGRNAQNLGVPRLTVIEGEAPAALKGLEPPPDAVFGGGGVSAPGLLEACWDALSPGGRLVANGVTLEAEQRLLSFRNVCGGDLTRLAVSRAAPVAPVGRLHAFRPLKQVTQLAAVKK
ncbi:MAG: cobalamin biosynthesis bifunctional protein CbiET [Rhodospirillaceae bacterium]|jgi:precorrin-6Y C5,15-methyltransferase (decarboxylating)|nr:cobalamin biosynthesis bifunctional protein CbiET [Rhodospirillaceae bacterium]|tara:strand:+ start:4144 stop:5373 length:1230 start_codon:yes stop_codon:yes gene_type:complete